MSEQPHNPSEDAPRDPRKTTHPSFARVAVVAAATALVLALPALTTDTFTGSDDALTRLPLLSHVKHVPIIFSGHFMAYTDGRYGPLGYAVIALVRTGVSPENAVVWNLWLLAFHVANALMIYAVVLRFTSKSLPALVALAVFLLHPRASTFETQVNLFPSVLGVTCYLAGFLGYLHFARTRGRATYLLALACFASGLLADRALLTLPVLLLLYELLHERTGLLRTAARLAPFALCVLAILPCWIYLHPHRALYVPLPKAHANALWFWMHALVAGTVDAVLGFLSGRATLVPLTGVAGGIDDVWGTRFIASGCLLAAAIMLSVRALLRKRWVGVAALLLLLGTLPDFGWAHVLTADDASWRLHALRFVGFALLAGAVAESLMTLRGVVKRACVAGAGAVALCACVVMLVVVNVSARSPETYWRRALDRNPRSEIASVALGRACAERGMRDEELRHLFGPAVKSVRRSCLVMAKDYSRRDDPLAAIVHFRAALREDGYGLDAYLDMMVIAQILYDMQAYDFAEQYLGTVLMVEPNHTPALRLLAEVQADKGFLPAAVRSLRGAAAIDPDDDAIGERLRALTERLYGGDGEPRRPDPPPDWLRYATDQGRNARMQEGVVDCAKRYPDDPILQLIAGICLGEAGEYDDASEHIAGAADVLSAYAPARMALAWVTASAGKTDDALDVIAGIDRVRPRDAESWHVVGDMLADVDRTEVAIACFRMALRGEGHLARVHRDLGMALARTDQLRDAERHLRRAVDLDVIGVERVHETLGDVLMRLGKDDEGIAELRKVVDAAPAYEEGRRKLASALMRHGRWHECVEVLARGVETAPKSDALKTDLVFVLSSAPADDVRDGKRALALGEALLRSADPPMAELVDALAAAYAEEGRFTKAADTARWAATLARRAGLDRDMIEGIEARRRGYQRGVPFRMRKGHGKVIKRGALR